MTGKLGFVILESVRNRTNENEGAVTERSGLPEVANIDIFFFFFKVRELFYKGETMFSCVNRRNKSCVNSNYQTLLDASN